jgi:hypothetical protein
MRGESSRNFILITLAVVALAMAMPHRGNSRLGMSGLFFHASYAQTKPQHHVFGDLAAVVDIFHIDLTAPGQTERLVAGAVTANFFQMIGVEPMLGRAFRTGEDSGDHVVILSYRLWQRRFHGAASVVGQNVRLADDAYRVIGILPEDFTWNNGETDVWVPCDSGSGAGAASYISRVRLWNCGHAIGCEPEI